MIYGLIIFFLISICLAIYICCQKNIIAKQKLQLEDLQKRNHSLVISKRILSEWIKMDCSGVLIADWFKSKGIETIAIYGMADEGNALYKALVNTSIHIAYGIDKNEHIVAKLDTFVPDSSLAAVDAVVITPVYYFESIRNAIKKFYPENTLFIGLDELIYVATEIH